eukprot:INCI13467.7.p1 GENE.INCI13467.7~~INCI13467.7.p1  ORF type:complete len:102 (-),score=7.56 INCI13467.7:132-437(-)
MRRRFVCPCVGTHCRPLLQGLPSKYCHPNEIGGTKCPPWQLASTDILGLNANADDDDNSSMFANGTWLVEVQCYVLDAQQRSTSGDHVYYRGEKNEFPIMV